MYELFKNLKYKFQPNNLWYTTIYGVVYYLVFISSEQIFLVNLLCHVKEKNKKKIEGTLTC